MFSYFLWKLSIFKGGRIYKSSFWTILLDYFSDGTKKEHARKDSSFFLLVLRTIDVRSCQLLLVSDVHLWWKVSIFKSRIDLKWYLKRDEQIRYIEFDELFKKLNILFISITLWIENFLWWSFQEKEYYYIFSIIKFFTFFLKLIFRIKFITLLYKFLLLYSL